MKLKDLKGKSAEEILEDGLCNEFLICVVNTEFKVDEEF